VQHIPSDGIVPWDFQAPTTPLQRPADSSAAMIAANGMLYISKQESLLNNVTGAKYWSDTATKVLYDNAKFAWKPTWDSLLANGTVNNPAGSNSTGIIYGKCYALCFKPTRSKVIGDYYFVQAGNTLVEMGLTSCPEAS
jgi:hypothetical protein